ncbi:MAG: hypothetical protein J0L61_07215 [Planctomycetes bacterium]|nr:hypothetical protein [Planctomycetota bacterium]
MSKSWFSHRHAFACGLMSAAAGSGVTLMLGQAPAPQPKEIECTRLRVVDGRGQLIGMLGENTKGEGGMLTLLRRGQPYLAAYPTGEGAAALHMFGKPGSPPVASLVVNPEDGGHVTVYDADGKVAWTARK